jgi:endogenous inhibitor of DNA gyrase (YacG/DUF329 family)
MSKCAICGKPQDPKLKPFCSKRCADVDLNRWFTGKYAIAAEEEDDPDAETVVISPKSDEPT